MALDLVDPLKDAARVVRDIRRAVFREAAEKAGRRRSHNDEAKERDAPHGPPQMLPGAAHWIGSPEQLPAGGGLPVDRTCLLEGGLYVLLRPSLRPKLGSEGRVFRLASRDC